MDLGTITDRMSVRKAIQCGNVQDAIEKVNDLNPEVSIWNISLSLKHLVLLSQVKVLLLHLQILDTNFSISNSKDLSNSYDVGK